MAKRLFVGSLPYNITEEQLKELFSKAGSVESVNVIIDRDRQQSKGFAFVDMATDDDAKKAKQMFDGYELDGRALVVNEARPKQDRPRSGYSGPRH